MAVQLYRPATACIAADPETERLITLELEDGVVYQGYSFGAPKSIAGELVFQTGMVGYPESVTDPSYRGQILVVTFPLVGNYGVPSRETMCELLKDLPAHFESSQIHIAGLVVATYAGEDYSHFLATSSLGTWLKEQGVPAMYGVDTRALTKRIREEGSMLGRMLLQKKDLANGVKGTSDILSLEGQDWRPYFEEIEWVDPNKKNLVAEVSLKEPKLYTPPADVALKHPTTGHTIRILCLDVGMKYNQLRCFLKRGVEVLACPWDYDFSAEKYDGLFISNGPGDPAVMDKTVKNVAAALSENKTPIFGICLGHQLLARASGAKTVKLKFGNRGHNIPCTSMVTGKCHITSQNHGYAVDAASLPTGWQELFVNANDGSNEGIMHVDKPHFSVQFHPESTPGPRDTEFLFDVFIKTIQKCASDKAQLQKPVEFPGGTVEENNRLHPRVSVKKVLVLGSGGLSIGQAGEFDYSGSQAIKALKEEGIYTVLINPNIATIQTSKGLADKVYFLPVNAEFVRKVIVYEKPDAIYCTFGGQTALSVGIELKDEFEKLGVKVLGTPIDTIITTEDRELFARSMDSIGEKCAKSASANNVQEALTVVKDIGYPVIVRAAYALGGLGSGFANNEKELLDLCNIAFAASPQVLIERSMKGWKEIEYEVVRDCQDNCITVCNMENFDPLGIHTGDSIVVAPSQTLSDEDYNMLRTTAVNVIRHLGVVGECNIQYALNPFSKEYCIIEVNARLSRSSALASKATGYPLAFIAAKLGLGIPLKDIKNSVTKSTCACFEPSLDYVVVKMPRWDLKKFTRVSTQLGSSMKSVGEVMSIGRTFEEAIQKAIRAIDFHNLGFNETPALMAIDDELQTPSDQRLFAIANAMAKGYSVERIWELTKIDKWFLDRLKSLSDFAQQMKDLKEAGVPLHESVLRKAKQLGFCDRQIANFYGSSELAVRNLRTKAGIIPFVKQIDTVAAEFPAFTNYLYLTYNATEHDISFDDHGVMVLGSGVYRIGSSVEFDWCSVRAIRTLREQGFKTIMVNYSYQACKILSRRSRFQEGIQDFKKGFEISNMHSRYQEAIQDFKKAFEISRRRTRYQTYVQKVGQVSEISSMPIHILVGLFDVLYTYRFLGCLSFLDAIPPEPPLFFILFFPHLIICFSPLSSVHVLTYLAYNPETVSTDYDEADKLYFENINLETVIDIYELEAARGVLGAMGGQTPNNIALPLSRAGVKVLGTSPDMIDTAENRYKFSRMLDRIGVDQPLWKELTSFEEAKSFCQQVSYPVLVRPSYVLSGAAMNTVYSENDLESYLQQAADVSPEHPVVITKYIENAKEIEMDAVAKDGKVVGHFISEHVENAGVHSGDATLVLPPQDLEKTTIQRIEEATRKIGDALNVTGPFNIQFIAKDNEIKVIECNVRASRSFPFVSKVMGVDLIEMATKAIMDVPFEAYPQINRLDNCVGVKVPQFSFSRLSGADPVLGVEMASTGEVASFGSDKYEAYLKALMSTGFKIPKKNILLSIGSYKDKEELLPSIAKLEELGYNLFATAGTADFLGTHGVKVQYLEVLGKEEDDQKSEYSLTQHLANKDIDLYINLPSNNRYRRPANYISKGYQTRRMAVDYQIPLVTNVKNAKILVEAIARHFNLEVGIRDYQTSHRTVQLPGLVNIAAFVPGLVSRDSSDLQEVTKVSVAAGFSMIRVMPVGKDGSILDAKSLKTAQFNGKRGVYCDFNFSVTATSTNANQIANVAGEVGSLFIPFNHLSDNISKAAAVKAHLHAWPVHKPIITDARTTDLAAILLLASLRDRRIHVTAVTTKDDIELIAHCKQEGLKVTCDVSIYSLYLSQKDYPGCDFLPTAEDQAALWEHLSTIDVFSIGSLPYQLAHFLGKSTDVSVGIADALPLLLTSVAEGKLKVEDITSRLHDNPREIFELHDQVGTSLEVEIDRSYIVPETKSWSPFAGTILKGAVRRVTFQDQVVCLDGAMLSITPKGNDMSTHGAMPAPPAVSTPVIRATRQPLSPTSDRQGSRRGLLNIDSVVTLPSPLTEDVSLSLPVPQSNVSAKLRELLAAGSRFKKSNVLSVKDFSRGDLHALFNVAQEMRLGVERHGVIDLLRNRLLVTLFYEPSTRTSASFDAAMQRLGGRVIPISTSASSVQKGESLQDTLRTVACYGDAVVLRHPDERSVEVAEKFSPVPVINGGNGSKEHPTQAFLDLFTIREELGTMKDLTITFVGDLLYGRPVHSLVYLLQHYPVKVQLVSPKSLALPKVVRDQLVKSGQLVCESENLTSAILSRTDVLYCTRVQKERFIDLVEYESVKDSYRVDQSTLKQAKPTTIVLHPLPRNEEVAQELDFDQRAAYFRQMKYGLYCRMALLALVLA